jgi:hypothetical protein
MFCISETLLLIIVEGMAAKYLRKEPTTGQIRSEAVIDLVTCSGADGRGQMKFDVAAGFN